MGEVYLAHDQLLKRDVALKFLLDRSVGSKAQVDGFLREARAAATLKHPSIFTIHEISETPEGQIFIVMDFYPDRTLKEHLEEGPLIEKTALKIFHAMAEGLASAHASGIFHRDIKPANTMVSDLYEVKILDFGLAKIASEASSSNTRSTYGTAAYMSPEQANGRSVDHRTDIWSLGVVLYEMLTGKPPFQGEFPDAVIYGILHHEPDPIDPTVCCGELQAVIGKMLAKNPDDRYQQMTEVLDDLSPLTGQDSRAVSKYQKQNKNLIRQSLLPLFAILALMAVFLVIQNFRTETVPARKSVASLPFENLTGDPGFAIWSTGFPQLIMSELSLSTELYVLNQQASETVYQAMGSPKTAGLSIPLIRDFGQRTQVETLVLGSIMKAGGNFRVQIQLQETRTGNLLTAATVDTESEDRFFILADSLAGIVRDYLEIGELAKDLSYGQESYSAGTKSATAYRKFLAAHESYRKREWDQAQHGFEQALQADPNYTAAQYMLIWTYRQLKKPDQVRELFDIVQAKQATLPLTDQYSLDSMGAILEKNHWQAIKSLLKVVDLDPQLRGKWGQLGSLYLSVEEPELARSALEKAVNLTKQWGDQYPWVHLYRNLAQVYVDLGLYDEAIDVARMGLETGDQNRRSMLFWICAANIAKGDQQETKQQLELFTDELAGKGVNDVVIAMNVGFIHLKAGHTAEAIPQMKEKVESSPGFFPAVSWLADMLVDAGLATEGISYLNRFLEEHPDHSQAQVHLAKIQIENDLEVDNGLESLENLRLNKPQLVNSGFLSTLGLGYDKQHQPSLAVAALEESWDLLKQYDHETFTRLETARTNLAEQ